MLLEIILGILSALGLVLWILKRYPHKHLHFWAQGLIIAALIYVIFALFGHSFQWLLIETLGVLLYGIPVLLFYKKAQYWLGIGWLAHVLWDLLLHSNGHPAYVPDWYPGVCLGFDLVIGGFILWSIRKNKVQSPARAEE